MNPVDISASASRDLYRIANFVSDLSPTAARRFLDDFNKALLNLREFPHLGHRRGTNPANRTLHVGNYEFRYRFAGGKVTLQRIKDSRFPGRSRN